MVPLKDGKLLAGFGIADGSRLVFKDLGPQVTLDANEGEVMLQITVHVHFLTLHAHLIAQDFPKQLFTLQVGYSKVFFWEYFGPMLLYAAVYFWPHLAYPNIRWAAWIGRVCLVYCDGDFCQDFLLGTDLLAQVQVAAVRQGLLTDSAHGLFKICIRWSQLHSTKEPHTAVGAPILDISLHKADLGDILRAQVRQALFAPQRYSQYLAIKFL